MEAEGNLSELEKAITDIFESYNRQTVAVAQRAVFLPAMFEEDVLGNEAKLEPYEPEFSEIRAKFENLKDNGATFIGVTRIGYFYYNAKAGHPLSLSDGETSESLEAAETLMTTDFEEALSQLNGMPAAEKDKLLMQAAVGGRNNVFLVPKNPADQLTVKRIHGVPAFMAIQFINEELPLFTTTLASCIDLIYESIERYPKMKDAEMTVLVHQL